MAIDLTTLNENQRAAVEWQKGPLLVLAGPGSGKTRVLTLRVARILSESPTKRFRVLGLTFTNKAAAEMRTRVDELIGESSDRVLLTTFHSFSADILRQHGSHVGLRPDFAILTQDADREGVLLDAISRLSEAGEDFDNDDVKLLPVIDRLLSVCLEPESAGNIIRDPELAAKVTKLFTEYRAQLITNNRLDFASLLAEATRLLETKTVIAAQLRTMYAHVCVDEFQDTNFAQYRILRALVGNQTQNLFVVADDDQIIYQWNGASPERLRALREDFDMQVIQLPANYRCPPEVIALANNLIKHNLDRSIGKKPLYAIRKSQQKSKAVRIQKFDDEGDEMNWIAEDIASNHRTEPGRCVVLARARKLLVLAANSLADRGLEASLAVRKSEFDSHGPVSWLHASLRLANSRGDREQTRRMCKGFFELEGVSLNLRDIIAAGAAYGGDLLRAFLAAAQARNELEDHTRGFLTMAQRLLVERLDFLPYITAALKWIDEKESRLAGSTASEGFTDYQNEKDAWANIQNDIIQKYGVNDLTLSAFLQELDLSEKSPPIPPHAVRCLTIHSAKGLEWEHVYLAGLAEDQLPSFQSIKRGENSQEMQEERRNCFVAITRAQQSLTLTYANSYFGWRKAPSRFLVEMGPVK